MFNFNFNSSLDGTCVNIDFKIKTNLGGNLMNFVNLPLGGVLRWVMEVTTAAGVTTHVATGGGG